MTARFLLHLREWDHHMTNEETDQWDTRGGVGNLGTIRFKKFEPHTAKWTINDALDDDPLLKPLGPAENSEDKTLCVTSLPYTGH